jgi:O-antigen ligase
MILFYFLVSVMPFSDPPLLYHLTGDWTFRLIGALCALYALLYLGQRRVLPGYFATSQARFFVLFYLIAVVSFLTKSLRPITESAVVTCTSYLILVFITLSVVDSLPRLRWVLNSASAAIAFGSMFVILEWIRFRNLYADFRPGYSVGDSNYFASAAVLILPFVFLRVLSGEARWEKWFYSGTLLVTAVALTLCASRGGFLGFITAFLVLILRSRHRVRNLVMIGLLVLVPTLTLSNSPIRRFLHPTISEESSNAARTAAWKAGMRMVRNHPVVGVGLGNFKELMPRYADPGVTHENIAHNSYIEVAAEMGIPQCLIFLAILFFSYRSFEQVRRRTKHSGPKLVYDAALGLEAGLIGHAVGAVTFSAEYQKLFWLVLCLSMCLPALVRGMTAADEKVALRAPRLRSRRTSAIDMVVPASPETSRDPVGTGPSGRGSRHSSPTVGQLPMPGDGRARLKPRAASSRETFKV